MLVVRRSRPSGVMRAPSCVRCRLAVTQRTHRAQLEQLERLTVATARVWWNKIGRPILSLIASAARPSTGAATASATTAITTSSRRRPAAARHSHDSSVGASGPRRLNLPARHGRSVFRIAARCANVPVVGGLRSRVARRARRLPVLRRYPMKYIASWIDWYPDARRLRPRPRVRDLRRPTAHGAQHRRRPARRPPERVDRPRARRAQVRRRRLRPPAPVRACSCAPSGRGSPPGTSPPPATSISSTASGRVGTRGCR